MARSGFVKHGERWPEWATGIMYGIRGGYQCFEDRAEGEAWYEQWKKENQPLDMKQIIKEEDSSEELSRTGKIGFSAA